jgi:hypothetical protein
VRRSYHRQSKWHTLRDLMVYSLQTGATCTWNSESLEQDDLWNRRVTSAGTLLLFVWVVVDHSRSCLASIQTISSFYQAMALQSRY